MSSKPIEFKPLTIKELKELSRPHKRVFLPDYVARHLSNRQSSFLLEEIAEIAPIIADLVETAHARMNDDGIEAPTTLDAPLPPLDSRERKRAATLAVLMPYHAFALFFVHRDPESAKRGMIEGIGWARTARDLRQESLLWSSLAIVYAHNREEGKQVEAYWHSLNLAEQIGDDPVLEILQAGDLIAALVTQDQLAKANELLEEKLEKGRRELSNEEQAAVLPTLLLSKGRILSMQNEKGRAIVILQEALDLAKSAGNNESMVPILSHLGLLYRYLGDEESNLACQREMVRIAEELHHTIACIWGYIRIAESYIESKDFESAEKALSFAHNLLADSSAYHVDYLHTKWASVCLAQGKFEEGIVHCRKVLKVEKRKLPPSTEAAVLHVQGRLQLQLEQFAEAEESFRQALNVKQGMEAKESITMISVDLSRLLFRIGRSEEATAILETFTDEPETDQDETGAMAELYGLRGEIAESAGEFQKALEYTRKGQDLGRKVLEAKAEQSLRNARVLSEIELLKREATYERQQREETERTLAEVLVSLEGKRHILDKVEHQLQKTLSFLEKEKAREVVYVLKNALTEMEQTNQGEDHPLTYLRAIDPEFFVRLRERWPDLTRKQERLCGLIRSGLTSNEIAEILHISYEGMRAQRKRLRKRFGLTAEENLEKMIAEV